MRQKITITLAILIIGSLASAQTFGVEMLYQKYRGEEGVVSIWLPGIAMKLAASISDIEDEEAALLRSIRSIRVLTIDENTLYPDVNFTKEAKIHPVKNGYVVLMELSEDHEDVMIMGKEKNGKLKDLLILVGGKDNVMVHIKGRMNADIIGSIAQIAGLDDMNFLSEI